MERQRKILVGEFQKEKQKMLSLDHKIKDISKHYGNGVLNNTQGVEQDELVSCVEVQQTSFWFVIISENLLNLLLYSFDETVAA